MVKPVNIWGSSLHSVFEFICFLACEVLWFFFAVALCVFQIGDVSDSLLYLFFCGTVGTVPAVESHRMLNSNSDKSVCSSSMFCLKRGNQTHLGCAKTLLKTSLFQVLANISDLSLLHTRSISPLTHSRKRRFLTPSWWNNSRKPQWRRQWGLWHNKRCGHRYIIAH